MKTNALLVLFFLGLTRLAVAADAPPSEVVYLEKGKVDAAFAQGVPLASNSLYKIHASRRVTAGAVEVHEQDTDIFYIVEGTATLVTGGKLVEPKTVAPGEIRAKESAGGIARTLGKGDVIVIPKGVPHWFKAVGATFLYFTVKVTG